MGLIPGSAIITHLSHDLGKLHLLLPKKTTASLLLTLQVPEWAAWVQSPARPLVSCVSLGGVWSL